MLIEMAQNLRFTSTTLRDLESKMNNEKKANFVLKCEDNKTAMAQK